MRNNRVVVAAEINVHQAVRAIVQFARDGAFGNEGAWLTPNEAVDLVAAAEAILGKVTDATSASKSAVGGGAS